MREYILINLLREVKEVLDKHGVEFWLDGGTLLGAVRDGKIIPWEHDIDFTTWDTNLSRDVKRLVSEEFSHRGLRIAICEIPAPYMIIRHRQEDIWVDFNFYHLAGDKAIYPKWEGRKLLGAFLSHISTALLNPDYYEVDFRAKPYLKKLIMNILVMITRGLPSSWGRRLAKIVATVYKTMGAKDTSMVIPADYFRNLSTMTFYGMEFRVPAEIEEYLAFKYGKDWQTPRRDWITSQDDGAVVDSKRRR